MKSRTPKNVAASIRQRLLNKAHEQNRPFNEILQYYGMERFLYRLMLSKSAKIFILKGALMFPAWKSPVSRPTMDIDMMGKTVNDIENIRGLVGEICALPANEDGIVFDLDSIRGERIATDAEYDGVRIRLVGHLENARINIQIDIGFGDVIVPAPTMIELPTVLDQPAPRLLGYSRESAIAEKFNAMLKLGELNSRMKDFYDIRLLSMEFEFDGQILSKAIAGTFNNRKTTIPSEIIAFSGRFAEEKAIQWNAFCRKLRHETTSPDFSQVVKEIKTFLGPVADALRSATLLRGIWTPISQWRIEG
jgi:hypothetical protein